MNDKENSAPPDRSKRDEPFFLFAVDIIKPRDTIGVFKDQNCGLKSNIVFR